MQKNQPGHFKNQNQLIAHLAYNAMQDFLITLCLSVNNNQKIFFSETAPPNFDGMPLGWFPFKILNGTPSSMMATII